MPLPDGRGVFGAMPAWVGQPAATLGIKVITVFPGNEGTRLDSHQGAVLLFDTADGRLLAVLDAKVGRDHYVVAFSSDHGVAALPEQTFPAPAGGRGAGAGVTGRVTAATVA